MKAADIQIGEEYAVCTVPITGRQWQSVQRVRVLEAPTVGWARKYSWGSTYPQYGKVDMSRDARNDHALVQVIERDYDRERDERAALLDEAMAKVVKPEGMNEDQERIWRENTAERVLDDTPRPGPYWKDGKEDRVRLRDIQMTWAQHTGQEDARQQRKADTKRKNDNLAARAEELSDRLPGDLRLERQGVLGHRGRFSGYRMVLTGGDHSAIMDALEQLLEGAEL